MKFIILALALVGAASAIVPLGYSGLGWGNAGLGWGHSGLGLHGGVIDAPLLSASVVSTPLITKAIVAPAPIIAAPIVKTVVAAPVYGHLGLDTGYHGGWGHDLGYAAPVWGIDAWKKKKAAH